MLLCVLGRQPELSLAELEAVFGKSKVSRVSSVAATVDNNHLDLSILGGTIKYGRVISDLSFSGAGKFIHVSQEISKYYVKKWQNIDHKITLGISTYGSDVSPRDVQKTGIIIKNSLKKHGVSVRLIPNTEAALSTAVSHNNKLGLSENKVELIVVKAGGKVIIAESQGAQNITAYARRDQNRPRRDAFVGMLPPKLAQMMLNLAAGLGDQEKIYSQQSYSLDILDPFCGTGTVLQEALLRGYSVHGSDLSEKMVSYTKDNLAWLQKTHRQSTGKIINIQQGDAMNFKWAAAHQIDAVVCETYLGQPFSAPPSPEKLKEVVRNCNHIITEFLKNIHPQLRHDTPLCIAVPSWRDKDGSLTHLPLVRKMDRLGYSLSRQPLIYSRPDQVVAREILVLSKI